jgi:hypothetical protein
MQHCIKISLFHIYMKLNMFAATLPVIRCLKLHWQPLVFYTWKAVGRVVGGRCQAGLTVSTNYTSNNLPLMKNQRLPVQF